MYDRCRHIRVDGARCRAMAINGKAFCYFHLHHRRRKPAPPPKPAAVDYGAIPVNAPAAQTALNMDLPLLEDRYAIQIGITQIVRALTANEIDPKRAGLLLYALQIASSNLSSDSCILPENVRQVVLTTSGDEIAPATTIFEKDDLSGHKKSCRCSECTFVQTDSEAHHADCGCRDCQSSAVEDEEATEVPGEEPDGTVNLNASGCPGQGNAFGCPPPIFGPCISDARTLNWKGENWYRFWNYEGGRRLRGSRQLSARKL